jgi:hypothetical protein
MKKFFKDQLDKFILVDIPCAACVWLFRALTTACDVPGSDFRCCIETALESATIPDIVRAISLVLNIDIDMPHEKTISKQNFLRKCVDDCIHLAERAV